MTIANFLEARAKRHNMRVVEPCPAPPPAPVKPTREQLSKSRDVLIQLGCDKERLIRIMTAEANDCFRQAAEIERELLRTPA